MVKSNKDRQTVLELKNVGFVRDRTLLDDIDWRVRQGEHWIILGRNGAGKTLLLQIVAGYIWPTKGRVSVLRERYGQVDLRELRQRIGWVSSALKVRLPGGNTALRVVLSGAFASFGLYEKPSQEIIERAGRLMGEMSLGDLAEKRFKNLSHGEQQRVILARCLMPGPELLILDEPCAGLDMAASSRFLDLIAGMAAEEGGPTLLMVTHRMDEIVPGLTHGLLMRKGRILASGPLDKVMTDRMVSQTMEIPLSVQRINGYWSVERTNDRELDSTE
ncbi:MAG: ATP-binding cassette domain-containing protein [Candidatus Adiutricales bacterium]